MGGGSSPTVVPTLNERAVYDLAALFCALKFPRDLADDRDSQESGLKSRLTSRGVSPRLRPAFLSAGGPRRKSEELRIKDAITGGIA